MQTTGKTCIVCSKPIPIAKRDLRYPSRRAKKKICSSRCGGKYASANRKRTYVRTPVGPHLPCVECGTEVVQHPRESNPRWAARRFCSRLCAQRWTAKNRKPRERNVDIITDTSGRRRRRGYDKQGRRRTWARIVAEEKLGRPLAPGEVVHHINGDTLDDRPENLAVLPSQADHIRIELEAGKLPQLRS